jgi:hypothetical protein
MEIPQDIIDSVIAAVGDNKRLLKKCALVSSSFLLPSRKQLFSIITLGSDKKCQEMHQFLVQNPVIQSFVRTITLTAFKFSKTNGTSESLVAILRLPFSCLECFSIVVRRDFWNKNPWNWDGFSSELKDALSNIIHSSTLKTLSFTGITKVPITLFLHTVHFTTLELHSISPNDFSGLDSSSLTRAASKGVAPMASHTVIDRCVWHFGEEHVRSMRFSSSVYFSLIKDIEISTESIFLPFICRLRFFKIYIGLGYMNDFDILSSLMGSLCVSLTYPATLEHLEFKISFYNLDFDIFYETLRDADVWSHLDSITIHPTGSRLQRVDINFDYSFRYDDRVQNPGKDKILKAVLNALPLLRTKGILFVKSNRDTS